MKTLFICFSFFVSLNVFSQNITNTLGANGIFSIKNGSTNYLTLRQSNGQLNILNTLRFEATTSSNIGVIRQDTASYLHSYGDFNMFLGYNAGNFTLTGHHITALGYSALFSNTTGEYNLGVGHRSLFNNTSGDNNSGVGVYSLYSNVSGYENTAVGNYTLYSNSGGLYNTAVGFHSLYVNTFGSQNTGVGHGTLSSATLGSQNTALGYSTGSNVTTGDNLTLIGYNAEPTSANANNQITLGNGSVTSLRCNTQTITSLSDSRDKKNISDLSLGIDFLMKIKPRLFNWDKREWYENNLSDGSKIKEEPTAGFIAQELDEVQTTENAEWLNLVLKDNPEKLEATYGNLLPVMVKAIQELKVESEKLKVENEKLKTENNNLKNDDKNTQIRLLKLEQTQNKLVGELEKSKLKESKITEVKGDIK